MVSEENTTALFLGGDNDDFFFFFLVMIFMVIFIVAMKRACLCVGLLNACVVLSWLLCGCRGDDWCGDDYGEW